MRSTKRVCGSGPSDASTSSSTPSTIDRPALHLAAEVGVARGVDDVDLHVAVGDRRVLGEDRDALLALEVHRVHDAVGHVLVGAEGAGLPEHLVDERGLAVIDVGDDRHVAEVLADSHRVPSGFGGSASLRGGACFPPMTTGWEDAVAAVEGGTAVTDAAAGLVAQMTEDERLWCLDGDIPFWAGMADLGTGGYHRRPFRAAGVERLGIPGFAFSDGPRGVVVGNATAFPVTMARGATWDVDLEERIGEAIGHELRAVGADLYGGVCVNALRHPAWGRAQETYGEDPHHLGEMGAALTRGVQRHVMATVKHFACNSMENARFKVDVTVDEQSAPRGVPPSLQAGRRRGRGLRDERLQRRQRRVVRRERHVAHRHRCGSSGASTASSSATGSSGCATPPHP